MAFNAPVFEIIEQDLTIDPSGFRDVKTMGFKKNLGTGAGGELNFGTVNTTVSGAISDTKLIYIRVSDLGSASGIFNMKFYLSNTSSFTTGRFRFLESKEIHFVPSNTLSEGNQDTPTTVPTSPNILGTVNDLALQNGNPIISGILDNDTTQYVYLAILAEDDVPTKTYGGAGQGTLRYTFMADYS
jgi:hypothetical protein